MNLPRRLVPFLLLVLLLLAGPLAAASYRPHEQSRLRVAGLFSAAGAFASRMWEQTTRTIFPLAKEGASIDPFGNPKPNLQPPSEGSATVSPPAIGD